MKTKKDLKDDYKQMKPRMGVFQIRNTTTNKAWIDSSTDLVAIWNRHKYALNHGSHANVHLQSDWKEQGEENFQYEILSEIQEDLSRTIDYKKEVKQLASMFIEDLQPAYNNK
jgi:hypothetical protein